jgi:hypothetical protein
MIFTSATERILVSRDLGEEGDGCGSEMVFVCTNRNIRCSARCG